jgi:hypothetical protein
MLSKLKKASPFVVGAMVAGIAAAVAFTVMKQR